MSEIKETKQSQAIETYNRFKELRVIMGKPVTDKIDPKKARRDLFSANAFM